MAYIHIEPKEKVYAKVYRVFHGAKGDRFTIDIKSNYPDVDYTALTSDDFIASYVSDVGQWRTSPEYRNTNGQIMNLTLNIGGLDLTPNYSPTTGILTIEFPRYSYYNNVASLIENSSWYPDPTWYYRPWDNLIVDVFMIVDGVREDYT